jgi:hypothetical protein
MSKTRLTLVLPDYAFLFASDINRSLLPDFLQRLLKKSRFEANSAGYYQQLIQLFSAEASSTDTLPMAMLRGGSANSLCADPCYLYPDRDKLRLLYRDLELSLEEAESLCQRVQGVFEEYGAKLKVDSAEHWLLELEEPAQVSFKALEGLHGQTVSEVLPTGKQAGDWIRLWNEVQMVLFDCPENQAREAAGKVPINSLWFWGQGNMPALRPWGLVSGNDRLLSTLAEQSNSPYQRDLAVYQQHDAVDAIHVMTFEQDQDWQSQLDALSQHWLMPAFQALKRWQLMELEVIVPEWGRYRLTPLQSWKFWI